MIGPWEQDEPVYYVLDPSGQVLDSFAERRNAEWFAEAHEEAVCVEARQCRRRLIWSAFGEVFK